MSAATGALAADWLAADWLAADLGEERYEAAALRLLLGVLAALAAVAGDAPGTREELIALLAAEGA